MNRTKEQKHIVFDGTGRIIATGNSNIISIALLDRINQINEIQKGKNNL